MVLAKPIIATDVSGVREILNNGEFGYIIPNGDEEIYNSMKFFLENNDFALNYTNTIQSKSLPFELKNAVESIEQNF